MEHVLDNKTLTAIEIEIRERQAPYFTAEEIEYYFDKFDGDFDRTVYELLIIKAEDSTISVSGLSTRDTSAYFRKLASKHRTFNSGILPSE